MNNPQKVLDVSQLSKAFTMGSETQQVIDNLHFDIQSGQFVSIMGPSGCGKSTLLYMLGGLDSDYQGQIKIFGQEYKTLQEREKSKLRRSKIGFIFQFYNLVPNLTVEENILMPLVLDDKRPSAYEDKLNMLLELTGLTKRRRYTPRELSGGQQQRVAIARSLIFEPALLLADEPIGNLDSKSGTEIMNLFAQINKELGHTIVQVTHSKESADFGNRIIYLRDGVIERDYMVGE